MTSSNRPPARPTDPPSSATRSPASSDRCSDILLDEHRAEADLVALDDQLDAARQVVARLERARRLAVDHLTRCREARLAAEREQRAGQQAERLYKRYPR